MNGGDVAREQRRTHDPPRERTSGKEEDLPGYFLFPRGEDANGQNRDDVGNDDGQVEDRNSQYFPLRTAGIGFYASESSNSTTALIKVDLLGRSLSRIGTSVSAMRSVIHGVVSISPSSIMRMIRGNWPQLLRLA
jgi:hypothetical protein